MSTEITERTGIDVRAAQPEDAASIAALMSELNRDEGYDVRAQPHALAQALFGEGREVAVQALVAVRGGGVIGALLYYPGYDTFSASLGYHLADMVVTRAHRRTGVGRALVVALARRTLGAGKAWVSLTVLQQNIDAQAFYTSLGMTRVGVDFFAIGKNALMQL